ncbi:MAG: hypothetical protein HZB51_19625 [Chloroflexi bacterium]|nr:hypothetical protein [Chloroflexota bacterium]
MRVVRVFLFALIAISITSCAQLSRTSTNTPTLVPTTRVPPSLQVFVEPDAGNLPIINAIKSAKKSIRMTMYLLTEYDTMNALKAARARGVDVRVMLEDQPYGSGPGNAQAMADLKAAKITVTVSNPKYRLTHQKTLIVDDRVAYILTFNLTHSAMTFNREYGIIDTNPADVAEIISVFEADWERKPPTVSNPNLVWSPINARERILNLIDSAQKTLELEQEEMQDEQVIVHLIDAAKRGVDVRVVMSPPQDGANDPNKAGQTKLTRGGVKLRMLKTPFIHAKTIIVDNTRALVSSQNMSRSSLDLNRELGIIVTDAKIVQTLAQTFASDWNIGK